MPEVQNTSYLSIGEVLGLLLTEFPDITISKIRFLESQGLIAPERTPSGYRKFYEADVELLKVILREQRENYLPLRVIKDRIDSGEIDASGEMTKPEDLAGLRDSGDAGGGYHHDVQHDNNHGLHAEIRPDIDPDMHGDAHVPQSGHGAHENEGDVPPATIAAHPAANRSLANTPPTPANGVEADSASGTASRSSHAPASPQLLPGVLLEGTELCAMTSITAAELNELRSYGIVTGRDSGGTILYGDDAVEIAKVAAEFLRAGVDARHLRGWRTAVEREASLFEQLITPRLRQRNPASRAEALDQLRRFELLGAKLRSALMRTALRHHFEG
jgi:DNA-binding transcriptional MerR regulator